MEFSGGRGGKDVAYCIVVGGMEETGKIIVVSVGAVELFEVASPACGGAGSVDGGVAWCAGGKKWEEVEADGGEEGN